MKQAHCFTHTQVQGITSNLSSPSPSLLSCQPQSDYKSLLSKFKTVTQPNINNQPVKHCVTHHISTTVLPISSRTKGLSSERLKVVRQEFEHMPELGIIQPSSSPWSSPLHRVPKKTPGDRCPCGGYRALNNSTIPDSPPHSRLHI